MVAVVAIAAFMAWQYGGPKAPAFVLGAPAHVTDISDDKKLVGLGDDVFFGQVKSQRASSNADAKVPSTQFTVAVLETLKGSLSGDVVVNQQGGTLPDGSDFRMMGDPTLLSAGKSYLFVTLQEPSDGYHTVVPQYGNLVLGVDDDASRQTVLDSEDANRLRTRFKEAVANQIPYDPAS
jgi:hypothetical protein